MRRSGVARNLLSWVIVVVLLATAAMVEASPAARFPRAFTTAPACWRYVNSAGETFLLKLRALRLGPTSFIVSGVLAGEEGQFPIFGNAELINGRVRSNLNLNDAFPSIPSTFLSAVQFAVTLDPRTLDGKFEWLSPTLSGPADGTREFQAYSLYGTLTFLDNGHGCARSSKLPDDEH
jgi:hypothetical protein